VNAWCSSFLAITTIQVRFPGVFLRPIDFVWHTRGGFFEFNHVRVRWLVGNLKWSLAQTRWDAPK